MLIGCLQFLEVSLHASNHFPKLSWMGFDPGGFMCNRKILVSVSILLPNMTTMPVYLINIVLRIIWHNVLSHSAVSIF